MMNRTIREATHEFAGREIRDVRFMHAGRTYVAIRFRRGRVELYKVEEDRFTETFLRYANPARGAVDCKAIALLSDCEDFPGSAERVARAVLGGTYGQTRNVRVSEGIGPWGTLTAEHYMPSIGRWFPVTCSIRLYNPVFFPSES